MRGILLVVITSLFTMSCSTLPIGLSGNQSYGNTRNFYRIETSSHGNKMGQGFSRSYGSKCFLVSANHIFENGFKSIAVDRSNNEVELELNKNYTYPTVYPDLDLRAFDISKSVGKCPAPGKSASSTLSSLKINEPLTLNIMNPSGEVLSVPLTLFSLPGVENAKAVFRVSVRDDIRKLIRGDSGGLVTSQSGDAIGMLIQIEDGLGIVQAIDQIDIRLLGKLPQNNKKSSYCVENKVICIGGAVLLVGALGAAAAGGGGSGESSETRPVSIQVPLP